MHFASVLATNPDFRDAVPALLKQLDMQGHPIDLAMVFMSPHFNYVADTIAEQLYDALGADTFIGTTGESIVSADQEIERKPAISLIAAHLPGVEITPFMLDGNWQQILQDVNTFRAAIGAPDDTRAFIMVAHPRTTPIDRVLRGFNSYYPDIPIVGGMASSPLGNTLVVNNNTYSRGAVGIALAGDLSVDIIVSQGCRPIGQPYTVTAAQRNVINNLQGQPPFARMQQLIAHLPPQDRVLLQKGLFIGRAVQPVHDTLGRGDFLIRGIVGIDQRNGSIAIGEAINIGETVQFHVRDAATAEEDLEMLLVPQTLMDQPAGAFLFTCNGRGTRLYDHPNGDIEIIQRTLGDISIAGCFCAGEIGPIAGKNFLHSQTASLIIFHSPTEAS